MAITKRIIVLDSEIVSRQAQGDGRIQIVERHVDSLGLAHERSYLADPDFDAGAALISHAAEVAANLTSGEIADNTSGLATVVPFVPSFNYSTALQLNAAMRAAYASAKQVAAVLTGAYLATLSDADLSALFGIANPSPELANLRTQLNAQGSLAQQGIAAVGA